MVVGIARIAPGPFLQLGPGASSLKKPGDRRRCASQFLVGLRPAGLAAAGGDISELCLLRPYSVVGHASGNDNVGFAGKMLDADFTFRSGEAGSI